jgi:hypothetical protein
MAGKPWEKYGAGGSAAAEPVQQPAEGPWSKYGSGPPPSQIDTMLAGMDSPVYGPGQVIPAPGPASRLTEGDRASPLPDELIERGKGIIAGDDKVSAGADVGLSLISGVRTGVESLAGSLGDVNRMQGDIAAWVARKLGASEETQEGVRTVGRYASLTPFAPTTQDVQTVTDPVVRALPGGETIQSATRHEPQTTAGEFAQTIGKFAPGVVAGPATAATLPMRAAQKGLMTVIPAVTSETAGQAFKGSPYENYIRAAAALLSGGATAFFGPGARTAGGAVVRAVDGATPQQIEQAEQLFMEAQRAGAPITRFEAIQQVTGGATQAGNIQRVVEGQGELRDFFAARPGQVEASARREIGNIAPAPAQPSTIGPAASGAAQDTLTDARGVINRITEPYYDRAATIRLSPREFQRVETAPGWAEARDAIRNNPQLARYVENLPDDSVGFLNEVQKYLRQQADNAAGPMNAQRNQQVAAGYGSDATLVRGAAEQASPDFRTAVNTQADLRQQYLDPLLQGPLGKLAKDDTTTKQAIEALFPRNPLPNSQQEITQAVGQLSRRRPSVARQLVRAHVESVFNQASRDLQSGANQAGGAGFVAALRGNHQQAANLEAAVRALPQGDQLWTGFDRYLTILEAQGQRQHIGSQTAFNTQLMDDLKAGNPLGTTMTVAAGGGLSWPKKALDVVERWRLGRNVSQLAELITNPAAGDRFRRLATATSGRTMRNIAVSLSLVGHASIKNGSEPGSKAPLELTVTKPANKVQ